VLHGAEPKLQLHRAQFEHVAIGQWSEFGHRFAIHHHARVGYALQPEAVFVVQPNLHVVFPHAFLLDAQRAIATAAEAHGELIGPNIMPARLAGEELQLREAGRAGLGGLHFYQVPRLARASIQMPAAWKRNTGIHTMRCG
jgi:hypothetical protein